MPDSVPAARPFVVERLTQALLLPTYPLVRDAGPGVRLAAWLRYARPLTACGPRAWRGALVIRRAGRAHPCGLFCYRRERDLIHGDVLRAEHFLALDLLDPDAVFAALLDGLDRLGGQLGCRGVRVVVDGERDAAGSPIGRGLLAAGHSDDGRMLFKPVRARG